MHRPPALTVVAWLFIAFGILAVIGMAGHLLADRDRNFAVNVLGCECVVRLTAETGSTI